MHYLNSNSVCNFCILTIESKNCLYQMAPNSTAAVHLLFLRAIYFVFGDRESAWGTPSKSHILLFLLPSTAFKHC